MYSNQKKVALYANGKLVEEKAGDKVFEFKVPLGGDVELKAVAGGAPTCALRSVTTIRRRDFNEPTAQYYPRTVQSRTS